LKLTRSIETYKFRLLKQYTMCKSLTLSSQYQRKKNIKNQLIFKRQA